MGQSRTAALLNKLRVFLSRVWEALDGWKSTIGLLTLYVENKYDLPDKWYIDWSIIGIYLWTGIGIGHKVKKQLGKTNDTKDITKEILGYIPRIRKLNNKL